MAIKLTALTPQNPWWKGGDWPAEDTDLKKIEYFLKRKEIDIPEGRLTVLRGVRRSGKTVYLKQLVKILLENGINEKSILYLSCDRYTKVQVKNLVSDFFIKRGGGWLLLDEVTYMEGWHLLLKELMEQGDFTVIATGSNPMQIKSMSERMPGRGIEGNEYYFNPLSFREFIRALVKIKDKIVSRHLLKVLKAVESLNTHFTPIEASAEKLFPYYNELETLFYVYLHTGGFPNAIINYIKNDRISYETYETLMRVILGTLAKNGKSDDIAREIMANILSIGASRTDFVSIARDLGLHHNTVRDYLGLLESLRLIYVLSAWDISKKRHAVRKQKKVIFQSPLVPAALHVYLRGGAWEEAQEFVEKNTEWLVEDTISSHIIWTEERPVIKEKGSFAGFYYSTSECDFVMQKNGKFYGFESKYGRLKESKYPFEILYLTKDSMKENAVPASLFLFGLEKGKGCI